MNSTPKSRQSTVKHEVKSRFSRFANNFCRKNTGFLVDFHLCKPPHGSRTQKFKTTVRCYTLTFTVGVKPLNMSRFEGSCQDAKTLRYLLRYYVTYYVITLPTTLLRYLLRCYVTYYVTPLPITLLRYLLRYYFTYYVTTLPTALQH
jgi:hypothetical protein